MLLHNYINISFIFPIYKKRFSVCKANSFRRLMHRHPFVKNNSRFFNANILSVWKNISTIPLYVYKNLSLDRNHFIHRITSNLSEHKQHVISLFTAELFYLFATVTQRELKITRNLSRKSSGAVFVATRRECSLRKMESTNAERRSQQCTDGTESSESFSLPRPYTSSSPADSSLYLESCSCNEGCTDCDYGHCVQLIRRWIEKKECAREEKLKTKNLFSFPPHEKNAKSYRINEVSKKTVAKSESAFRICVVKPRNFTIPTNHKTYRL